MRFYYRGIVFFQVTLTWGSIGVHTIVSILEAAALALHSMQSAGNVLLVSDQQSLPRRKSFSDFLQLPILQICGSVNTDAAVLGYARSGHFAHLSTK